MVKLVTGGGSDLSPDMQKIVAKLKQLLKNGKKLDIGIDELKKKAGVFNVKNATVSAYINRKKEAVFEWKKAIKYETDTNIIKNIRAKLKKYE